MTVVRYTRIHGPVYLMKGFLNDQGSTYENDSSQKQGDNAATLHATALSITLFSPECVAFCVEAFHQSSTSAFTLDTGHSKIGTTCEFAINS